MSRRISVSSLMEAAQRATGLDDFGVSDFETPLAILVGSYNSEAELNPLGVLSVRRELVRMLSNRLHIEVSRSDLKGAQPDCQEDPVVILGLPRSGTTFLQRLLAADPDHRYLRHWEGLFPRPAERADALQRDAERQLAAFSRQSPSFAAVHTLGPDAPEECVLLFDNAFASYRFEMEHNVPTYSRWLTGHDMASAYDYYRLQLALLSLRQSGTRWLLKAVPHLGHLDELIRVFPRCRLVHIHRDPVVTIASLASLTATVREAGSGRVDRPSLGTEVLSRWSEMTDRYLAMRAILPPEVRVVDLSYDEFVGAPLDGVRRTYSGLEMPLPDERHFRAWLARDRGARRAVGGRHAYDLQTFGLDVHAVEERFGEYRRRFIG
jgi:hypothetical protein